ncbi:MAG: type I 3-dehydroquinate dehydratase [Spirochaetaceae bacterium]|jgi:3-dehydroquinate dehydratase/shikimate dehydrogenase|nr:type I 3-dehydroquinate dehydratase [Spirochaetaceae bacterium]
MADLCLCLTGKTLAKDLEILKKYQKYADLAELRVDCLEPDERLLIRRFPGLAGIPVILTIRRDLDGGYYSGGEGSRIALFAKGLTFADENRQRNFAYVDFEEYLQVPTLDEAARTCGARIIRSYHNMTGVDENLGERLRNLQQTGDELVKVAVSPQTFEDVVRIFKAGRETLSLEKILIGMGPLGGPTRILAELMGSRISYASVQDDPDLPALALGQFSPRELSEDFRFRSITSRTRLFGIIGYPLQVTSSPGFFNALFKKQNRDAVYVPFPADTVEPVLELAKLIDLQGLSITVPHKTAILPHLLEASQQVQNIGACNTIVTSPEGWKGYNTDAQGFSDSLLHFLGEKNLRGKKATIIGAGGVAKAVASEVHRLHGKALILNRTPWRAQELAQKYHFSWGGTEDIHSIKLMDKFADLIIQTTSAGMEGHENSPDPLENYRFTGREKVMDLIYKPERTVFLKRAEAQGCSVLNGADMLIRQAKLQYEYFFNTEFPESLIKDNEKG